MRTGVLLLLLTACAGSSDTTTPPMSQEAAVWNDAQKCDHMCMAYCVHKHMCDASPVEQCRMVVDDRNGGTCMDRAHLFSEVPQEQVEACIAAIEAMSCPDFAEMNNTGKVPAACVGILS